ncbi:MBL fold metallo-hydrolase [Rhodococcus sp. RS1C4]|uniref:MBL fold metallo-hydrolase n=1 Tax=Nocardiaceae TaxID=85025 RepID=UPI000378F2DE|nr:MULTISPECIES: MBL fold metallo-hydrolase [Rhodococcus]OZC46796.1 MBL fold metallo-hydrolase [Rhodococcus sp. 06-621-2]OZC52944.1 MBL fold metallo-hydrolase [Rhodococcus sp. RS1C4]OZC77480.1 MBL fold metallo-hydrolase [Rhodococcus sp. 06-418-1B]OZC77708.1 MBL fold metallo-hydrolase [Rhodococcus sp. 06-418-1B]OZD14903.1 MBL fold metallo-hydrolase [Rhodococcus sp. 06-156-4C]
MTLAHPAYGQLRQVTPTAAVLLADNPGKMTLDGTNTWILRAPGSDDVVVVDPGPKDKKHLDAVAASGTVVLVLVTHRHGDHTGGLKRFHKKTGAPIRAFSDEFVYGSTALVDGEVIEAAGLKITVLATPGHTADSSSFVLDDAILTGDTILGRGTTVLDPKDGTLADYLASLDRLEAAGAGKIALPGHGAEVADTAEVARMYRKHRLERLEQIKAALAVLGEDAKPMKVVKHVYADVDKKLWPAARMSVKAQLTYLRES